MFYAVFDIITNGVISRNMADLIGMPEELPFLNIYVTFLKKHIQGGKIMLKRIKAEPAVLHPSVKAEMGAVRSAALWREYFLIGHNAAQALKRSDARNAKLRVCGEAGGVHCLIHLSSVLIAEPIAAVRHAH